MQKSYWAWVVSLCVSFLTFSATLGNAEWMSANAAAGRAGNVGVISDLGSSIVLSFEFGGFEREHVLAEGTECVRVAVPGMAPTLVRGEPEVPIWAKSVIIPDEGEVSIRILSSQWEEMVSPPIVPSKGNLPRSVDPDLVPYEFGDVYRTDEWSPSQEVDLSEPFILRDFRGVTILAHPIQYNGARRVLRMCTRLEVEITVDGTGGINPKVRSRGDVSREFLKIYQGIFLNLDRQRASVSEHAGKMLIVAANQFYDDMANLVDWKREKGIDAKIVKYPDDIGGTGATAMKNYILNMYNTDGVVFVLLVGDLEHIPTFTFASGEADPMYSLLEGADVYPDAFISRFSTQTSDHVETMVRRSIEYERSPTADTDWYHMATGIASNDNGGTGVYDWQWMEDFREKLLAYTYTHMDQIYDPGASASEVSQALNEGRGLVLYMGHGSTTSWGTTGFSVSNINGLTNNWELPVISCVACSNGDFSYSNCFGEAWLRASNGESPTGAIACYASSIGQSWVPPQYGQQGFVDSLVNDSFNTVGGLLFNGSVAMLEHYGGAYAAEEIFNTWIIFGDCSVQFRSDIPVPMTVYHPPIVPLGTDEIHVSVAGVGDALVGFSQDGEFLASAYTDDAGEVDVLFSEPLDELGTILVTVTAYNKAPYQSELEIVQPSGPIVVYTGSEILGDTQADIGETISLNVELTNIGSETAPLVQGSLSTAEPEITMVADTQDYGDIAPDASALPNAPFGFEIGTFPDGVVVDFDLDIETGDSLWLALFGFEVHAPVLALVDWLIDDSAGSGNGLPDPGETVDLFVTIGNSGSGNALEATLTIENTDPYVTIVGSSTGDLGTIPPGGEVSSPAFTLMFDDGCPVAHVATFPINYLSNNGTYSATGTLELVIGQHDLLFVDTDNENTEGAVVAGLDALGIPYTRIDAHNQETVSTTTLMSYRTVVWAAGDQNASSLTPQNQENVAFYLDHGGAFLFSAENYLSTYANSSFTTEYLHVDSYETNISGSTVNGVTGDPIGDGITVDLSYPSDLSQYPDQVTPDAEAAVVFRMQGSDDPVVIRYPGSESRSCRLVFFAVSLEAFPINGEDPNNVRTVVARTMQWFGDDVVAPTTPTDVCLDSDGTLTWSPSSDNVGVDHYCIYRQTNAFYEVDGLGPVRMTTNTSEPFPGSVGNPETNYYFRVTAVDAASNESLPSDPVGEHDYELEDGE